MDHIATSRNDTGDDEIAQRMQIMMYHRIDGGNIELMVQKDKTLSHQIAGKARQDKRQDHLPPRDPCRRTVEAEQNRIHGKQDQQRDESKKNLVGHICHAHSRKQTVLPRMVE